MQFHQILLILAFCLTLGPAHAGEETPPPIPQSALLAYLAGKGDFQLIDARSPAEYAAGHIYGAVNVPHDADLSRVVGLPGDTGAPLVVYCKSGKRAAVLRENLLAAGYTDVRVLGPAQILWSDALPVFNCGAPAAESAASSRISDTLVTGED